MVAPSGIVPDTKDWTWVLERACPECGFDASTCQAEAVAALVRVVAVRWMDLHAAGRIRSGRNSPAKWSSLEYACHVRDVFTRFDARFELMLTRDDPLFPNWDQDASAIEDRYDEQDPEVVVVGLRAASEQITMRLDAIGTDEWQRPGRRSDGASFTVETMSRYMVHDPIHHLWDVTGEGV
jgi:hypothetical protein